MKLLLDANIFLEVILGQAKAVVAGSFLRNEAGHEFFITDFSLHSIGLLLLYRKQYDLYRNFLTDIEMNAGIGIIALPFEDMANIVTEAEKHKLDFDDAYQYVAAENHDLTLVSFDHDFDRTPRGRQTPEAILKR